MRPWKRVEPTVVTKIGYRTVVVKHFVMPNGKLIDWTVTNEDGWAAASVIALTPENKVVVARMFRPGPEKIFDDLPGGVVDNGESPEACAVRELAEEVGYRPGKVEYLGKCYYDVNVNGTRHHFLATDCVPTGERPHLDYEEAIETRLISIDELIKNAKTGKMVSPGAVLLAYDELEKRRTAS